MYKSRTLVFITFTLCLAIVNSQAKEACDKSQCRGPVAYYEALKCKPIYRNPGDCCPYKYNCDHLKNRLPNKCYIGYHEYDIGEKLREEDALPCDIGCTCRDNYGIAGFTCAIVDCLHGPVKPGCYLKNSPLQCCPGKEVCPENPEDRAVCNVDGKEYRDGEYFEVVSDPELSCVCNPGFKGEYVEPFCLKSTNSACREDLYHSANVYKKCAPVYYSSQIPSISCGVRYRCQNKHDVILKQDKDDKAIAEEDDMTCEFGNIVMHRGDELNQATHYDSVCVICICEMGPIPTCMVLPDDECDVTDHPIFEDDDI